MKVVLAESLGLCFGVRDAIDLALTSPHRSELTILGELAHNPAVNQRLREAGIGLAPSPEAPVTTSHVMITAHGAADSVIADLEARGHQVHQATCPLVRHAHRELDRLVADGYFPVIIGRSDHVEVRGLTRDLAEYVVVLHEGDLEQLIDKPRLGVISQTTQPLERVTDLVRQMRERFPAADIRFRDTVCQPTKERQAAARRLAASCEVVIVVGGENSNNTLQLARTCEAAGARAYRVSGPDELRAEWFEGVNQAGLTAGTSTLDETIEAVRRAMSRF